MKPKKKPIKRKYGGFILKDMLADVPKTKKTSRKTYTFEYRTFSRYAPDASRGVELTFELNDLIKKDLRSFNEFKTELIKSYPEISVDTWHSLYQEILREQKRLRQKAIDKNEQLKKVKFTSKKL